MGMEFIIVSELKTGQYGGTSREGLPFVPSWESDPGYRELWAWYAGQDFIGEADLPKAFALIREYRKLGLSYQVIEVAKTAQALGRGEFTGYDISLRGKNVSLLEEGLRIHNPKYPHPEEDPSWPILRLIQEKFQPCLNDLGLFTEMADASNFREIMIAFGKLVSGVLDPNLPQYEVVALGLVTEG